MKEQLIDFETAKLAKEKGFDESTDNWYRDDRNPNILYGRNAKKGGLLPPIKQGIASCLAPTQSLLQKWLREKHNIDVIAYPLSLKTNVKHIEQSKPEYTYTIYEDAIPFLNIPDDIPTFEQALEKGLIESLKLIN